MIWHSLTVWAYAHVQSTTTERIQHARPAEWGIFPACVCVCAMWVIYYVWWLVFRMGASVLLPPSLHPFTHELSLQPWLKGYARWQGVLSMCFSRNFFPESTCLCAYVWRVSMYVTMYPCACSWQLRVYACVHSTRARNLSTFFFSAQNRFLQTS